MNYRLKWYTLVVFVFWIQVGSEQTVSVSVGYERDATSEAIDVNDPATTKPPAARTETTQSMISTAASLSTESTTSALTTTANHNKYVEESTFIGITATLFVLLFVIISMLTVLIVKIRSPRSSYASFM
jgi:hypothetical protein